jgi:hypothetical protein
VNGWLEKIENGNGGESDIKMLKLTIENKELKRRLVEWKALQKEC